jgi:hypothetical protein
LIHTWYQSTGSYFKKKRKRNTLLKAFYMSSIATVDFQLNCQASVLRRLLFHNSQICKVIKLDAVGGWWPGVGSGEVYFLTILDIDWVNPIWSYGLIHDWLSMTDLHINFTFKKKLYPNQLCFSFFLFVLLRIISF